MRDHNDGGLRLLRHLIQDTHDAQRALAVQRCGGLVRQNHRRAVGQRAGNGDALLLPARELRGLGLGAVRYVQRSQQLQRAGSGLRIGHTGQHGQQGHVVGHVQKRNQVRRLKYKANAVTPQGTQIGRGPAVVVNHILAQRHAPGGRLNDGAQAFEQRAFAGAGRPHQAHHLAGGHRHVDVFKGFHSRVALAIDLAQAFDEDATAGGVGGTWRIHGFIQWRRLGRP